MSEHDNQRRTSGKQLTATGRFSSCRPALQNVPMPSGAAVVSRIIYDALVQAVRSRAVCDAFTREPRSNKP